MKTFNYHLVDVFTSQLFGGNQLAVFTECNALSTQDMQNIAKELNLSESVFVFPAEDAANDYLLRIFTPDMEMPMAGHPTIGAAYILAKLNPRHKNGGSLKLEEKVGVITVELSAKGAQPAIITMQQPLPEFGKTYDDRRLIAKLLSIDSSDIDDKLPMQVVSTGVAFLYIPLNSLAAMKKMKLRSDLWETNLQGTDGQNLFIFCRETEDSESTVHSRMFAPAMGIKEDPATGAASGPLGAYLVKHGLITAAGRASIVSEQGYEMGRPSIVHISIETRNHNITKVAIGGECVPVGGGFINLDLP